MAESPQVKKLREQLDVAMAKEKLEEAITCLSRLERLEPNEPRWSQRLGDVHRRQKQNAQAIAAYERAVERFARGGFLARAVAMAKTITSIDPARTDVLARIQQDDARGITEKARAGRMGAASALQAVLAERKARVNAASVATALPTVPTSAGPAMLEVPEERLTNVPAPGQAPFEHTASETPPEAPVVPSAPPRLPERAAASDVAPAPASARPPASASPPPLPVSARPPALTPPPVAALAVDELGIVLSEDDLEVMPVDDADETQAHVDDGDARTAERLAVMPSFALFAEVPREALLEIASRSELVEMDAGEVVIRTGDPADSLYAIVEGSVRVLIPGLGHEARLPLREGEVFGEACLLTDEPRHADVVVDERLVALRIPKDTLDELVRRHEEVGQVLRRLLTRRLLVNLIKTAPLFAALDLDTRRQVVNLFELVNADSGTVLLEAKKRGSGLFIPLTGKLEVLGSDGTVRVLPAGSIVGITSLLSHGPLSHTVRTLGDTVMLRLSSDRFMELITQYPTVLEQLASLTMTDALS